MELESVRPTTGCERTACLEGAAERLIPGLGRRDPDQLVLVVAGVEVEMSEELGLGEGVGGIDAEEWLPPGRLHVRGAADLDAAADAQAIGHPREALGWQIDVADAPDACPQLIAEGEPGNL